MSGDPKPRRKRRRASKRAKTAVVRAAPPLVKQEKGGAIYQGGVPGNKGGGRHKSAVRADFLAALDESLPVLKSIVHAKLTKHGHVSTGDKIRAAELFVRVGMSETISRADALGALKRNESDVRSFLAPLIEKGHVTIAESEELIGRLLTPWMAI